MQAGRQRAGVRAVCVGTHGCWNDPSNNGHFRRRESQEPLNPPHFLGASIGALQSLLGRMSAGFENRRHQSPFTATNRGFVGLVCAWCASDGARGGVR